MTLTLDSIRCEIEERVLFSNLSAEFREGDLVQVVGPNGAGKTTLLKMLTGLSHRYEGELRWCGQRLPNYDFYCSLLHIGHTTGVKSSLTPLENLNWYFGLNGLKGEKPEEFTQKYLIEALEKVGLTGYEDVPSYQMSAGQQRRVALARLYVSKAPLWVLDEPFTAIDKQGVAQLEAHVNQHREQGGIVILTTHQDMSYAKPIMLNLADYAGDDA